MAIRPPLLDAVAATVGHRFSDEDLLNRGLTHASWCDAQATDAQRLEQANERLEFVGDALLGAAIALCLYERHPMAAEGAMSRAKSALVSRKSLAKAMDATDLLPYCRVGKELKAPWPESVKANIAEGLLAAVYYDAGWTGLVTAVERLMGPLIDAQALETADVKNRLQAHSLELHGALPAYACERIGGSDHAPVFKATVTVGDRSAAGTGSSRRQAEKAAATAYLNDA